MLQVEESALNFSLDKTLQIGSSVPFIEQINLFLSSQSKKEKVRPKIEHLEAAT